MALTFGRIARPVRIGLTVALGAALSLGAAAPASADPVAAPVKESTSIADHRVKVYELLTKDGGFFYTASETEKDRAVTAHGWSVTKTPMYYLSSAPFQGGKPLYRLRWTHKASYIITGSDSEREKLVASGSFRYEGVLGYAPSATSGKVVKIFRLTNNGRWRLAIEAHTEKILANEPGWKLDGPLLYQFTQDR
ncbi:hypothetical protein GCM10010412_067660 [Nonomuraea recticatena]|uniref:DUF5648 domain-containing protein n=1 Tax=Nonomuraea recticatena TaxID=46178 RepID=A0ABN3SPC1_9ACTN